ncbi:MAG: helix-turn-helix domain-containing protein, partial [Trebonia sp.]
MEHRKADVRQAVGHAVSGDDAALFLRELRQLRDCAGLGHAELAARAHFPFDSIRAAEVGPALPDLPVLSAYVRGCGGTAEDWEERWRSLTRSPSLPVPASRTSGRSDAATAGARIGSVSQVGDNPDPSIILAALSRVAEEMAGPASDSPSPD